jgi:hypothetical protein
MQSGGEVDVAAAAGEVLLVEFFDAGEVRLHGPQEALGEDGDSLAHALSFADGDLAIGEVDIFDPQPESLKKAQPAAVQEVCHEAVVTFEIGEDGAGFGACEDDGQLGRAADALDAGDVFELLLKDLLVKEEQGTESLILRRGGDPTVDGEVTKEGCDLWCAHLGRMSLLVKEDETPDPVEVAFLGAYGVALDAKVPANAVE